MAEPAGAADVGVTAHIAASNAAGAILNKIMLAFLLRTSRRTKNRCQGLTFEMRTIRRENFGPAAVPGASLAVHLVPAARCGICTPPLMACVPHARRTAASTR